ncbi:15-hydroxyprostaglandin dehydrogenase [NAD(+)] [Plakobranchus ocellatus]|uniref:15-hydroxyprostaglandin dehydrogenase [NAD(+)] n=1 Tax=Plakobranchus ocellatus TaxID=259542 RepID=A0AAV4CV59_9GAST|nr:15-hydroxyprostaglandin dehydrogenase [NAD(+)] [Plakobranchus ocellatus]
MLLQRSVFITGAVQGLGKAFSEALLERGARVCLTDVQAKKGFQVEKELQKKYGKDKCTFLHCDVSSPSRLEDSFKTAVRLFGHIDLVVNNAGIADESQLENMVNVNLLGAIRGSMLGVEHMRTDKGGRGGVIINIASTAGLTPVYFFPFYSAAKFGLVGFHLSCASNPHLKKMGVQFGCLCPAFTDTDMIKIGDNKVLYANEAQQILKQIGINKVETVVEGFLQLIESPNCNGDIITVSNREGIQYKKQGKNKWKSHL